MLNYATTITTYAQKLFFRRMAILDTHVHLDGSLAAKQMLYYYPVAN